MESVWFTPTVPVRAADDDFPYYGSGEVMAYDPNFDLALVEHEDGERTTIKLNWCDPWFAKLVRGSCIMRRGLDMLLVIVAVAIGIGGALYLYATVNRDPKPKGYRDPVALAVSVRDEWDLENKPSRIHDVSCIVKSKTTALCIGTIRSRDWDNGDRSTLDILIAKDGRSWISH